MRENVFFDQIEENRIFWTIFGT